MLKRTAEERFIAPYNQEVLKLWQANMDLQFIHSPHGAAAYVCSYITKDETAGLRNIVADAVAKLPQTATTRQLYTRIATAQFGARAVSVQEAAALVGGDALKAKSREVISISVGYPERRTRMLRTTAVAVAWNAGNGTAPPPAGAAADILHPCIYDYYERRPPNLRTMTLAEFASVYKFSTTANGDHAAPPDDDEANYDPGRHGWPFMQA
jgi:hypothetical protein